MAVTIMEKITSLAQKLVEHLSAQPHLTHLTLKKSEMFSWDHTACVIYFNPGAPNAMSYLLHECGHALCNHAAYTRDVELLAMEREAWNEAMKLAAKYEVRLYNDSIESALDSYRDWLHSRSLCPSCSATGIQTASHTYSCLNCHQSWRVNEARTCALRRYTHKKRSL
jgi:hypothetical protein